MCANASGRLQEFGSNLGFYICAMQLGRKQLETVRFVQSDSAKVAVLFAPTRLHINVPTLFSVRKMRPSDLQLTVDDRRDENSLDMMDPNGKSAESQSMICLDGETDLNRMMRGDFSPLRRPDCAFRFNEVLRWAWESWRAAVGYRIGQIYPYAIQLMNTGAKNNGRIEKIVIYPTTSI